MPEPPLSLIETRIMDANAEALGVSVRSLMATAGQGIAEAVQRHTPDGRVVILAGRGNNGGDGVVAAARLAEAGRDVTLIIAGAEVKSTLSREALATLPSAVTLIRSTEASDDALDVALSGAACVVDALLGSGTVGEPRGEVARLLERQAKVDGTRIAVDVPTAAGSPLGFAAVVTLALHAPKVAAPGTEHIPIEVIDIGIPDDATRFTGPGEFELYPRPAFDQHKGQGGFVLVLGGGPYSGAPALAATSAMRVGADLSIVLTPAPVWGTVASFSPNIVARPLIGDDLDLEHPPNRVTLNKWLGMVDALVVGPGLGKMDPVSRSVPLAVERALELGIPVCADADALWALAKHDVDLSQRAVVTPHAREFEALTGLSVPAADDVEGRVKVVMEAASDLNATVLLKGPTDVISDGERVRRNATGTPSMSRGGTGDVLAGVVGGLLAKGLEPFDAARLGAYITGKAGEQAARQYSHGLLATDVLEAVPTVLKAHLG